MPLTIIYTSHCIFSSSYEYSGAATMKNKGVGFNRDLRVTRKNTRERNRKKQGPTLQRSFFYVCLFFFLFVCFFGTKKCFLCVLVDLQFVIIAFFGLLLFNATKLIQR